MYVISPLVILMAYEAMKYSQLNKTETEVIISMKQLLASSKLIWWFLRVEVYTTRSSFLCSSVWRMFGVFFVSLFCSLFLFYWWSGSQIYFG